MAYLKPWSDEFTVKYWKTSGRKGINRSKITSSDIDIIWRGAYHDDLAIIKFKLIGEKNTDNVPHYGMRIGFVDWQNNLIIGGDYIIDEATDFQHGVAVIQSHDFYSDRYHGNEKCCINKDGNVIGDNFSTFYRTKNGLFFVNYSASDIGKDLITDYRFVRSKDFYHPISCPKGKFSDVADDLIKVSDKYQAETWFINGDGDKIIDLKCKFDEVSDFKDGYAYIFKNGIVTKIDKEGREIEIVRMEIPIPKPFNENIFENQFIHKRYL